MKHRGRHLWVASETQSKRSKPSTTGVSPSIGKTSGVRRTEWKRQGQRCAENANKTMKRTAYAQCDR
ncbi:unnamed protein product [Toxocara canis]|uniref:Secreted protein n=1 Tax=Toxocara canis TaxID=6265 RepID=A0A183U4J6_TOXCA|nr:unnamed protein product [Toxocara canis]